MAAENVTAPPVMTVMTVMTADAAAQRYRQLPHNRYDLAIIGGGSAGISAADLARALGASVALIEREKLGGECLYTGCVPSKALLHAAQVVANVRAATSVGLRATLEPTDLGPVMDSVKRATERVYIETDAPEHLLAQGIDVAFGAARFRSPRELQVNGQTVTARHYLIATGSHPAIPPIPGLAETGFLTNETIFSLRELPARLAIIGGGPIGCELGQAFARLGSQVTILQRPARLLPKDEPEASALLQARLVSEGVMVLLEATVKHVMRSAQGITLTAHVGQEMQQIESDAILIATGRAPNVASLDLDVAGVQYDAQRGVHVDAFLRASNPHIYAAGDVTGGYLFAHAAARDARLAVRNALFPGARKRDTHVMPWATFTEPEIAHVGLTEVEARSQHGATVQVTTQAYSGVDRAVTDGATTGFVKLVHTAKGQLLGAQIVGPRAGDNINELTLALAQRLTLGQIAAATHVYPTLALAIQQAAGIAAMAQTRRSSIVRLFTWLRGLAR